ncbi:hypothetical protein KEM52_000984 [Ascosphaera acerosa]|nr:hypothetical protein KEM52_000984 [Ascosphaera acerosa]
MQSQRDVSFQVPINYVPHPSVALTPACFAHGNYTSEAITRCVSNLLASGLRRFFIDLYWNPHSLRWQLCPIYTTVLPDDNGGHGDGGSAGGAGDGSAGGEPAHAGRRARQVADDDAPADADTPDVIDDGPAHGNKTLLVSGDVKCSTDLQSLDMLLWVFQEYFRVTENTLSAQLHYFILRLKPARLVSDSPYLYPNRRVGSSAVTVALAQGEAQVAARDGPRPAEHVHRTTQIETAPSASVSTAPTPASESDGSASPSPVSGPFVGLLGNRIYTPGMLQSDRANVNKSWYSVPEDMQPISEYFTLATTNGHLSHSTTRDGWPCEEYVEMILGKRLLLGFDDSEDNITTSYNLTADEEYIFRPGTLSTRANITASITLEEGDHGHSRKFQGRIEQGCLYNADSTALDKSLDQWWYSPLLSSQGTPLDDQGDVLGKRDDGRQPSSSQIPTQLAAAMVDCGVSLFINATLANKTADVEPLAYLEVVKSSIWSTAAAPPST